MRDGFIAMAAVIAAWYGMWIDSFVRSFIGEHGDTLILAAQRAVSTLRHWDCLHGRYS
jgi:hypothetical protein